MKRELTEWMKNSVWVAFRLIIISLFSAFSQFLIIVNRPNIEVENLAVCWRIPGDCSYNPTASAHRLPIWRTKRWCTAIFLYPSLLLSGAQNWNWLNQFVNNCWLHLYRYNHASRLSVIGLMTWIRWWTWPAVRKKVKWRLKRSKL